MSATVVEARFLGGAILVEAIEAEDVRPALVEVNLPGLTVTLFPNEARRLAVTLIEHAARAETPALTSEWP